MTKMYVDQCEVLLIKVHKFMIKHANFGYTICVGAPCLSF